jgi:hypothetical protein
VRRNIDVQLAVQLRVFSRAVRGDGFRFAIFEFLRAVVRLAAEAPPERMLAGRSGAALKRRLEFQRAAPVEWRRQKA